MHRFVRQSLAIGTGVVMAVFAGAGAWAQKAAATGDPSTSPHTLQMVPAVAELSKTIDAKKAKQGDLVTAKLQQPVQIPDEQTLPRNAVLEGHVDQVTSSEHKSDSTVVVTFDKVKLKDGKELPIKATVISIYEPVFLTQQVQQDPGGGMPSMPANGGSSGGGARNMPTQQAPQQPQQQPQMNIPDSGAAQQSGQPPKSRVPGVALHSDIHEQSSATFTSRGRNVKVPDGTQMEVALAVMPAGVKLQQ